MFILNHLFPPNTQVVCWAEPTDDGPLFEAVVGGCVVRANDEHAFLEAVYGENVVPMRRAA